MPKLVFLFLLFHSILIANKSSYLFVIFWNVGQGQWVTAVTPDECQHFDFGGEISYFRKNQNLLLKLCKNKQNSLKLSHPDLDHYAYFSTFTRLLPRVCWNEFDHTSIPEHRAPKKYPLCTRSFIKNQTRLFKPDELTNKNDSSKIYKLENILLPGDSSKKMEKTWAKTLKPKEIKYLLLGHHGSRTSTSDLLLKNLPQVRMAIVQSRQAKFNHPHKEVLERLGKHHLPLLRTEDWGNTAIVF